MGIGGPRVKHPNDDLYDAHRDRIAGLGDFDGDQAVEILTVSDSGIGILKQGGDSLSALVAKPNDTWFGGWNYDSTQNQIAGIDDFNGDGRDEFVFISPWSLGVLSLVGDSFGCLDLRAYDSSLGNW